MKKLINLGLIGSLCFILLSSSYSLQDDPDGKAGASGAPGETTCNDTDCHNSFAVNSGTGSISISSPDLIDWSYVPGTTYTLSVTVEQSAINLFGLCFEALKPNGDNAGTLHAGIGTQIKNKTIGGFQRKSITHNNNTGATSNTHTFTFTWDAPTTDIGDITFYAAGLAANGDDHESDDRVYSTSQVVTASSVGLDEIARNGMEKHLFPNPASDFIHFSPAEFTISPDEVRVVALNGATVAILKNNSFSQANDRVAIPIAQLQEGTYTLYFLAQGRTIGFASFQCIADH
jgi:hypothetical protein